MSGAALLAPAPKHGTAGRLVYAVGDIHGRDDLLGRLMALIEADAGTRAAGFPERPLLVFLGDYIDRGPRSREVLGRLAALQADPRFETRCLLGNHEEAMLDFLDRRTGGGGWSGRGGRETLLSYGIAAPLDRDDRAGWSRTRDALRDALPPAHEALLRGLLLTTEVGDLLFVHAGLRPNVAVAQQDRRDLLWIRSEFLRDETGFDRLVVHGHTPGEQAFIGPHRVNLDTGAYASGILSAARFDGTAPVLLDVGRPGG